MSVSILIVNWNSKDYLRKCLQSIETTCSGLVRQVIVVDAGSFDGCDKMLATEFPHVEFIQSEDNLGFSRSNNLGFERVRGEFLLLLNPDTELTPQALGALLKTLQQKPDAGIVAPRLLNTDGSLQESCVQALPRPINQALDCEFFRRKFPGSRLWGVKKAFSASQPVEVEAVSGACMMLRSETFLRVGGFSPEFFMYGEDMDLCAKVGRLGLKVYHVPEAMVVHHGGGSSHDKAGPVKAVMMRVAGETYMKLNRGTASAILYRVLQALSAIVRLQILLPFFVVSDDTRRKRMRDSIKKWFHIFLWCIGLSPIRIPSKRSFFAKSSPKFIVPQL